MNLLEQWAAFMERWNREYEQIVRECRRALLKIVRRMRGVPEFVQFCQQTERKARRQAKYYRRIQFKTWERHGVVVFQHCDSLSNGFVLRGRRK